MAIPTDPAEILKSVTDPNGTKAALDLTAAATGSCVGVVTASGS